MRPRVEGVWATRVVARQQNNRDNVVRISDLICRRGGSLECDAIVLGQQSVVFDRYKRMPETDCTPIGEQTLAKQQLESGSRVPVGRDWTAISGHRMIGGSASLMRFAPPLHQLRSYWHSDGSSRGQGLHLDRMFGNPGLALQHRCHQGGPTGLVACTQSAPGVGMKVFVEQQQILPCRIVLIA